MKEGFKPRRFLLVERLMKGCQECFSEQSGLGLLRDQILSFSLCVRQRDGEGTFGLAVKTWGNTFCKLLNAVLERGDRRLLSEMVLYAETGQGEVLQCTARERDYFTVTSTKWTHHCSDFLPLPQKNLQQTLP